jgi:ribosomal protein S18 acetylase RimI-like enzyme
VQEDQAIQRAYLSNVCTAAAARRRGVAAALMKQAEHVAQEQGATSFSYYACLTTDGTSLTPSNGASHLYMNV